MLPSQQKNFNAIGYPFKISVVMAVYKVEEFIREAIDSILNQKLGFLENIQLVLVDDGSPDNSGAICDEYAEKYPHNIVVIHKENGGAASARNEGLKYTRGRYINFCDPDDKISGNAFFNMYNFIYTNREDIDIVTMPLYFFDAQTGEHWQNVKFKKGNRIINLHTVHDVPLLITAASLFNADKKDQMYFDPTLPCAEDAKMLHGVLFDKMAYGVVADCKYFYRRRFSGGSLIQTTQMKKSWYFDYFYNFFDWLDEESMRRFGYIPAYVQYLKAAELQWRYRQFNGLPECLTEEEYADYCNLVFDRTSRIEDQYIMEQRMLFREHKIFMLSKKYGRMPTVSISKNDALLHFDNTIVCYMSQLSHKLHFLKIENKTLYLEGSAILMGISPDEPVEMLLKTTRGYIEPVMQERVPGDKLSFNEPLFDVIKFKFEVDLSAFYRTRIDIFMKVRDTYVKKSKPQYGKFFPVDTQIRGSYYYNDGFVFTAQKDLLYVRRAEKNEPKALELAFIKNLKTSPRAYVKKASYSRKLRYWLSKFKKKPLWIISDRRNKGDDNGEALFKYLLENNKKKDVNFIYTINQGEEYERIKKYGKGRVIARDSKLYKVYHMLADCIISSHAEDDIRNPFPGYSDVYVDLISSYKYVFLQHGITLHDLSDWLKRENKDIALFVTAAQNEYNSIITGDYNYTENEVKLTGFARHDLLYHNEKRIITIMPTWRKYLMSSMDANGKWSIQSGFSDSNYFKYFNALLNDERLLSAAEKYGYTISFMPHPNIIPFIDAFTKDPRVVFRSPNDAYRDVFAEADMLVTDYSSVAFDFAYLRKPLIYTHFDADEFFSGNHVSTKGYFDYDRDGFGEVEYTLDSTIDRIIDYIKNGCKLKSQFDERINEFFAYNDKNNCERVYNAIYALCEAKDKEVKMSKEVITDEEDIVDGEFTEGDETVENTETIEPMVDKEDNKDDREI